MHILVSHAGSEKVRKYIAENYDMTRIKESVKEVRKRCESKYRNRINNIESKMSPALTEIEHANAQIKS